MDHITETATQSMLKTLSSYSLVPQIGEGYQFKDSVAHVQIDFFGDKKALLIMEMPKEQACSMASAMMAGMGMPMEVNEFDEMTKSALGELCNQMSGGICTTISNDGVILDIKPPQIDLRAEGLNPARATGLDFGLDNKKMNVYFLLLN